MGISGFLKLLQQLYINYDDEYLDNDNANKNYHQNIYIKDIIKTSNKQIDIYIDFNSLIYILDDKKFLESNIENNKHIFNPEIFQIKIYLQN